MVLTFLTKKLIKVNSLLFTLNKKLEIFGILMYSLINLIATLPYADKDCNWSIILLNLTVFKILEKYYQIVNIVFETNIKNRAIVSLYSYFL